GLGGPRDRLPTGLAERAVERERARRRGGDPDRLDQEPDHERADDDHEDLCRGSRVPRNGHRGGEQDDSGERQHEGRALPAEARWTDHVTSDISADRMSRKQSIARRFMDTSIGRSLNLAISNSSVSDRAGAAGTASVRSAPSMYSSGVSEGRRGMPPRARTASIRA